MTSGVEGRGEEGPGEPGEAGSDSFPPLTGLDRLELREEAAPNGALRREREREKVKCVIVFLLAPPTAREGAADWSGRILTPAAGRAGGFPPLGALLLEFTLEISAIQLLPKG